LTRLSVSRIVTTWILRRWRTMTRWRRQIRSTTSTATTSEVVHRHVIVGCWLLLGRCSGFSSRSISSTIDSLFTSSLIERKRERERDERDERETASEITLKESQRKGAKKKMGNSTGGGESVSQSFYSVSSRD